MSKRLLTLFAVSSIVLANGCASTCNSWSPREMWANRPRPLQKLFRGEACNTCNPPVGQLNQSSGNVIHGCNDGSCAAPYGAPSDGVLPGQDVPYYPSDALPPGLNNTTFEGPGVIAPGPDFSGNSTTTNYPPAYYGADSGGGIEFGSAVSTNPSGFETNSEVVAPPMYGSLKPFN